MKASSLFFHLQIKNELEWMIKVMGRTAVIFDLDGVIVSTDEYHYQAWKQISKEENLLFNREINEKLRGVSRSESLEIILKGSEKQYSDLEKEQLTDRKNDIYKRRLTNIGKEDILQGVYEVITNLKEKGIRIAIGSSSKNAKYILGKIELLNIFDQVVDGTDIKKSKPDPEVFLLAAERLKIKPHNCVVVEDATAGIDAALAAGMKSVGVGSAAFYSRTQLRYSNLDQININELLD